MTAPLLAVEGLAVEVRGEGGAGRVVDDLGFTVAAGETLTILSNIAHQNAAQGSAERPDGNVQAQFERANNARIVWRNIPWPQMRATFLRAISASSSEYDIVMIVDEAILNECGEPRQMVWFADVTTETRPMMISSYTVPEASGRPGMTSLNASNVPVLSSVPVPA